MRNIPYSIISLFFIFIAVAIALVAVFPRSPLMAGIYLAVALGGIVLILISYCAKCPCRNSECRHMFPGELIAFLPRKKDVPYSLFDILSTLIGFVAIVFMPQLWLASAIPLLILFWALMLIAGFMIVFLVCPVCPNTWGTIARVKKVSNHGPTAGEKLKSVFRLTKKKKIALLVLSLGIFAMGYLSLGLFIIQPVGTRPEGVTVIYFRLGLHTPLVSYLLYKESGSASLPVEGLETAKSIIDRKIVSLPFAPGLYLPSAGGTKSLISAGTTSANQSSKPAVFDLPSPRYRISRDSIITYFFIGHSNMGGYCAQMDIETSPNVWLYNDSKGFYHGTDFDLSNNSGSPGLLFLKRMALLYPDYHFCGVKYSRPGMTIADFLTDKTDKYLINKIKTLKKKSIIGGVLLMFGFDEGIDFTKVQKLDVDLRHLIEELRKASGNGTLPFIFGRYEKYHGSGYPEYHRYDDILIDKIDSLEEIDPYLKLTPIQPIPKQYYCDDHHYTAEGYQIWADDAAAIIQKNKLDFWKGR